MKYIEKYLNSKKFVIKGIKKKSETLD